MSTTAALSAPGSAVVCAATSSCQVRCVTGTLIRR